MTYRPPPPFWSSVGVYRFTTVFLSPLAATYHYLGTSQLAISGKQPMPDWRDAIWGKERQLASGDSEGETQRAEREGKRILG